MKIAHRIIDGSYASAIDLKRVSTRRITNLSCMSAASVHQLSRSTAAEILVQRTLVRSDTTFELSERNRSSAATANTDD